MAYLVVREPGRVAFAHTLGDACAIGRGDDNDLVLADKQVSRLHARIEVTGASHAIHDLQSRHGTYVNSTRVSDYGLHDGDVIQLGSVLLVYEARASEEALIVESVTAAVVPRARDEHSRRLLVLYDLGRIIGAAGEEPELAGRLLDSALEALDATLGVIELGGARRVARGVAADKLVLGRPLLDALVERQESLLVADGARGSAVGAPLALLGQKLGFVYVTRAASAPAFTGADRDFLNAFAHLAAAALAQAERQGALSRVAVALRDDQPAVELIGDSPPMLALRERVARLASARDTAVLIRGESGTGKELVARLIHARSPRADQPFVAVNCAAIPETLIESELFGHEKGAFTGAAKARRGKFALAHGGTLFLDEVGDLSASAQAKVLRAIEEGEVSPVGAETALQVDVRVLSATHKPLEEDIAAGRFRADLFYRLCVVDVTLPPLRARGADVVLLAETFLARAAQRLGKPATGFTPEARAALRGYTWPGNVRQLANEVERALLLADGPLVDLADLRARIEPEVAPSTYDGAERDLVARAFKESAGNIRATARALGVSRGRVYRKLVKYNLVPEDE